MRAETIPGRPVSLHQRILSDIGERIVSGEWPPGTRIPFEHELTRIYGCSRMTVSKALSELARAGLIERRRRAGSYVRRPHTQSALLEIRDIGAEVQALGLPYRHAMVARRERRRRRGDDGLLDAAGPAPLLDLTCLHFAGGRPFCLENRLINLGAVPEARGENFAAIAPGPWLMARVPWTTAEHRILAAPAESATARALALPDGTACLVVERRTWSGERQVTFARFTYPGDAHDLVARFSPSQG
jgi:GntR family transcriptional regulator, histidine utilization repressor